MKLSEKERGRNKKGERRWREGRRVKEKDNNKRKLNWVNRRLLF